MRTVKLAHVDIQASYISRSAERSELLGRHELLGDVRSLMVKVDRYKALIVE